LTLFQGFDSPRLHQRRKQGLNFNVRSLFFCVKIYGSGRNVPVLREVVTIE
jgi:hypothetical protein